jgi:hypothetical protein
MKPTKLLLTLSALFIGFASYAQDKEVGVYLGTAQYQGDLSQNQLTINETKPAVGILGRYYFNPRFDIKGNLYLGWIAGADSNYSSDHDRYKRNLSFHSIVVDLGATAEFNLLPYISNSKKYRFAPVLFAGVSLFYFNPMAYYGTKEYALQPLGTEGQNLGGTYPKPYSRVQVSIPMGVAFKYSLGNFWNLGLEISLHKTFTDYIDDVSGSYANYDDLAKNNPMSATLGNRTGEKPEYKGWNLNNMNGAKRGNPQRNDTYIFAGFTLTKTIRRFSCTGF